MLYHGVYRPKVEYPLGQTFLTDKQVKKIESASLPKIIAKCGYNRNMARDIRGGPKELGGTGFTAFLNTIGATRVQHFIKNRRTLKEDIGKMLNSCRPIVLRNAVNLTPPSSFGPPLISPAMFLLYPHFEMIFGSDADSIFFTYLSVKKV